MSESALSQVELRHLTEPVVAVPDSCIGGCKQLKGLLELAAVDKLDGLIDAVICDDDSRRHTFPRNCPGVAALVTIEGSGVRSPFYVGESSTEVFVDRVDSAIEEHGVRSVSETYREL